MDDKQLAQALKSAGMVCFVDWLAICKSPVAPSEIKDMMIEKNYSSSSCNTKISSIRSIIRAGRERDALLSIIEATHKGVKQSTKRKAKHLLEGEVVIDFVPEGREFSRVGRSMWQDIFSMPKVTKVTDKTSTITHAFVCSIVPIVKPTDGEIQKALDILGMAPNDLRCSYCGFDATEWDHLRPLVRGKKPTGYISEIRNLVPSCGKCNQSKGNKDWQGWIKGKAKLSPYSRNPEGLEDRIERLTRYEIWGNVFPVDLKNLCDEDLWNRHWENEQALIEMLKESQAIASQIRSSVLKNYKASEST